MSIKSRLSRYHETLVELVAGILPITLIVGVVGAWIVSEKLKFCISLLIGAMGAVLLAIHIYITIDRGLDMVPEDAGKYAKRNYALRLIFMILVVLCGLKLPYLHFGGIFLGLLTLKASVYLRPLTHKIISAKVYNEGR